MHFGTWTYCISSVLQLLHRLQAFVRFRKNKNIVTPLLKQDQFPSSAQTAGTSSRLSHEDAAVWLHALPKMYNYSNVMNADNGQPSATCPALDRYSRWQLSCEGCKKRWQAFQWVEPMAEGPRCEANFLSEFMRRPPPLDQHQLTIRDGFSHCNSLKCFRMPKHQVDRGPFMSICWLRVEKARQFSPARNNHLVNTIGWQNLPTTRLHTLTRTEGQMAVGACLPAAMHQIFFLYHNP